MQNPIPRPMNPETPKAREVKKIPLPKLYPQPMEDDVYTPSQLDKINEILDKASDEDSENSN
jgi:hypothetical protein